MTQNIQEAPTDATQEGRTAWFTVAPWLLSSFREGDSLYQAISQLSTYQVVNGRPVREDEPKFEELKKALLIPEHYTILAWYSVPLQRTWQIVVSSPNLPITDDRIWMYPPRLIPKYQHDEYGNVIMIDLKMEEGGRQ